MKNQDFTMTREYQIAKNFGMIVFENGHTEQVIYKVFQNEKLIKVMVSTNLKKEIFCHVIKMSKENVYDLRFSTNPKKKYYTNEEKIVIKA